MPVMQRTASRVCHAAESQFSAYVPGSTFEAGDTDCESGAHRGSGRDSDTLQPSRSARFVIELPPLLAPAAGVRVLQTIGINLLRFLTDRLHSAKGLEHRPRQPSRFCASAGPSRNLLLEPGQRLPLGARSRRGDELWAPPSVDREIERCRRRGVACSVRSDDLEAVDLADDSVDDGFP